jgi:hypothetical protein
MGYSQLILLHTLLTFLMQKTCLFFRKKENMLQNFISLVIYLAVTAENYSQVRQAG